MNIEYKKKFCDTFAQRFKINIENKMISDYWFEVIEDKDKKIEELRDKILEIENERDILKSKLSETKADIHYLLENGESIYIRNKYIRGDKE